MNRRNHRPKKNRPQSMSPDLREQILADFSTLKVPLTAEQFDALLARAEREGLSHLEFTHRLIAEQAAQRRERSIAHRIREAGFRDDVTLAGFDWEFNAKTIDRVQIENLATCDFIRRRNNLIFVGQSGVGKSRIIQSIGRQACVQGLRVRYRTSAALLEDLNASLADHTMLERVRYYARFDFLIIDEFGFDRIERKATPESASLLYKVIDARLSQRSTALVTNIDFQAWAAYLDDSQLAMAFTDRLVDGAIILKLKGKSYRAHRSGHDSPEKTKS